MVAMHVREPDEGDAFEGLAEVAELADGAGAAVDEGDFGVAGEESGGVVAIARRERGGGRAQDDVFHGAVSLSRQGKYTMKGGI